MATANAITITNAVKFHAITILAKSLELIISTAVIVTDVRLYVKYGRLVE